MHDHHKPLDAGVNFDPEEHGLHISEDIRNYWIDTTNWARVISVLLYILFGFLVLIAVATLVAGSLLSMIMVGGLASVVFQMASALNSYITSIRDAVRESESYSMEIAFSHLVKYFTMVCVWLILLAIWTIFKTLIT